MEDVDEAKLRAMVREACQCLSEQDAGKIDADALVCKIRADMVDGMHTWEIEELSAQTAAYGATLHPAYSGLAAAIAVSALQRVTPDSFSEAMEILSAAGVMDEGFMRVVRARRKKLNAMIDMDADYFYDYFGFKTLEKAYLLRDPRTNNIVETPQYLLARVAVGIHGDDMAAVRETYAALSWHTYTHATPTLFNAGTKHAQLASCFLLPISEDSIEGIFATLGRCAAISKHAGGLGLAVGHVRGTGTPIAGTNGSSNGLVPMLRVFNETMRYVDQGGGKRKGSCAVYIEPWHADVLDVLDLKKNSGKEELRARDLFYALWIPDLFMRRVREDGDWSLFCPHTVPRLAATHGEEFEAEYLAAEKSGTTRRRVLRARELWARILDSQIETGQPYMMYKDACNAKSNHSHLGTIRCSNLCTEIVQFSSPSEVAVCNLASLSLPAFVKSYGSFSGKSFHLARFVETVGLVVRNLNKVLDVTFYPLPEAAASNGAHRPLGLGVQGLADVFAALRLPWESEGARALNRDIFEALYYGALRASCDLARRDGPYASYAGSPASRGILQCDMWGVTPSEAWDWAGLRADIRAYGLRNSLLVAPMPTASTSQILGNNEAFEPFTSNLYVRRVAAGDFPVVNRHLVADLEAAGLWDAETRNALVAEGGSIARLAGVPGHLKELYKTVWEIPQRTLLDMAADRGAFIDQSQSMNVFMAEPTHAKLTSMHFYGWERGLKTGMYYLRTRPKASAIQITVDAAAAAISLATPPQATAATATTASIAQAPAMTQYALSAVDVCVSCGS